MHVVVGVPYKDPEVARQKKRERYLANQQASIEYARRQRRERAEEISAQRRKRYAERSPEWRAAYLEYQRRWYDEHPEACRDYARKRRAAHPEDLEYFSRWRREHPEAIRTYTAQRRGRAAEGMTAEDKADSIEWRKAIRDDPCFYCGAVGAEVYEDDHYVSVANGGTDHWWNLVRACQLCNRAKAAMNGDEFLALRQVADMAG